MLATNKEDWLLRSFNTQNNGYPILRLKSPVMKNVENVTVCNLIHYINLP